MVSGRCAKSQPSPREREDHLFLLFVPRSRVVRRVHQRNNAAAAAAAVGLVRIASPRRAAPRGTAPCKVAVAGVSAPSRYEQIVGPRGSTLRWDTYLGSQLSP